LTERGIAVSYESIRLWCPGPAKVASMFAWQMTGGYFCQLASSQRRCFKVPTWRTSEHKENNRRRPVP